MPTTRAPAGRCAMLDMIGTTATVVGTWLEEPMVTGGRPSSSLSVCAVSLRSASASGQRRSPTIRKIDERGPCEFRIDAGAAHQFQPASVRIEKIEDCEGHILGVLREDVGGGNAGLDVGADFGDPGAQVPQDADAPLADDLLRDLVHRREHAADAARRGLVGHRAVADGEVAFFDEPIAPQFELEVFDPGRRATVERCVDQRPQHVPDLGPAITRGDAHGARVLGAEDRRIRVVVDLDVVRPPPQKLRKAVREHERHHHAQHRAPAGGVAERRRRPVDGAGQPPGLGVCRNELESVQKAR